MLWPVLDFNPLLNSLWYQGITTKEHKHLSAKGLTTVRLLFIGWKVQQSSSLDSGSLTSRMHRPSSVFQMRRVPSSDVDTMMSLLRDQAKSVTGPPWPFRVTLTLGGDGESVMMDRVPSREQQARRCLSSLANCKRGTKRARKGNIEWNKCCLYKWIMLNLKLFTHQQSLHVGQICGACQRKHNFHSKLCLPPWHDWPLPRRWAPNCPEACSQKYKPPRKHIINTTHLTTRAYSWQLNMRDPIITQCIPTRITASKSNKSQ